MKEPIWSEKRQRWMVDLREVGGGRRFFKSQAAAKVFRSSAITDHKEFGRLAFDLPVDVRQRYLALDRRAVELGTTLEACVDAWAQSHRAASEKRLSEAAAECLAAKRAAGRRNRYVIQLASVIRNFVAFMGGDTFCSVVTVEHLHRWLDDRNWRPETRQSKIGKLSAFLGYCVKREWLRENPAPRLEPISLDWKRPGILTVPQVRRLFAACQDTDRRLIPWLTLSLFCGLRFYEACRIAWADVDLKAGYVRVESTVSKTRERRLIKLQPNAIAWLRLGGDLPVQNIDHRFRCLRRAARFSATIRQKKKRTAYKGEPWPRNAMRHSFCSYCLPVFGELKESEWAGHSPAIAIRRYRELVTEESAREFWQIAPP